MNGGTTIRIEVAGETDPEARDALVELASWFPAESEPTSAFQQPSAPEETPSDSAHPTPRAVGVKVFLDSTLTSQAFRRELLTWYGAHRRPSLRITTDTEQVEIPGGFTPERAASLVDQALNSIVDQLGDFLNPYTGRLRPLATLVRFAHDEYTLPVTIYVSDEAIHAQVESAVDELLANADLAATDWDEPIIGSWFRSLRAGVKEVAVSPAAREAALAAMHGIDSRVILIQDAYVTSTLLQNLGPVIASLQPTKDAVLRIGALLIVKVDWVVQVFQLTAAQQALLDHQPQLAMSPHDIIAALQLAAPVTEEVPPAVE
jgi:hypothetical protein